MYPGTDIILTIGCENKGVVTFKMDALLSFDRCHQPEEVGFLRTNYYFYDVQGAHEFMLVYMYMDICMYTRTLYTMIDTLMQTFIHTYVYTYIQIAKRYKTLMMIGTMKIVKSFMKTWTLSIIMGNCLGYDGPKYQQKNEAFNDGVDT